jgi:hypothetical protein
LAETVIYTGKLQAETSTGISPNGDQTERSDEDHGALKL